MPKEKGPPLVAHGSRPELGVGEVNDVVRGDPPVLHVYWPDVDLYGYYLVTDLRRMRPDGTADDEPPRVRAEPI